MTILYFYQYFSTPNGSWGTRVFEFGKRWAKEGHKVIVVTSIYDKSDLKASGISSIYDYEGVKVIVLNLKISNKHSILYRIFTFVAYSILSSFYAIKIKADVVIASSGPITAGIPGLVAKKLAGRKLIFEVRDMWPEGAIQMGIIKNERIQKLAYWFENLCYKTANRVVTLSPGMKKEIEDKGFSHVESVPNASDNIIFSRNTDDFIIPEWMKSKKVFLYTGNIGQVNNSFLIIKAAELLRSETDLLFLFIGDGQQREEIQDYITSKDLSNVKILGLMPKNDLVAYVQRAYFMMVPLEGKPILDTSSPNKLFDSLAAGIPVIQTTQGWIKDLLTVNQCGITVSANDPAELAFMIQEIIKDPERRNMMAQNAKKVAIEQFERGLLSTKMLGIIKEVSESK